MVPDGADRSVAYDVGVGSLAGTARMGSQQDPEHAWDSLSHVRWECKYRWRSSRSAGKMSSAEGYEEIRPMLRERLEKD